MWLRYCGVGDVGGGACDFDGDDGEKPLIGVGLIAVLSPSCENRREPSVHSGMPSGHSEIEIDVSLNTRSTVKFTARYQRGSFRTYDTVISPSSPRSVSYQMRNAAMCFSLSL